MHASPAMCADCYETFMVLNIILIVLAIVFVVAIVILVSPIRFRARFALREGLADGGASLSWLHPAVLRATFDVHSGTTVSVFGKSIIKKKGVSEGAQESGRPFQEPPADRPDFSMAPEDALPRGGAQAPDHSDSIVRSVPEPALTKPDSIRHDSEKDESETRPLPDSQFSGSEETTAPHHGLGERKAEDDKPWEQPRTPGGTDEKKTGFLARLKRNRVVFFLRQASWRKKTLRWIARVLGSFLRLIRFDHLVFHARAGLNDPAQTGKIIGWCGAATSALDVNNKPVDIRIEPDFTGNVFEFNSSLGVKTSIGRLMAPLAIALVAFPYVSTLLVWWRSGAIARLTEHGTGSVGENS